MPSQSVVTPDLGARVLELVRQAQSGSDDALGDALQACRQYLLWVANARLRPDLRAKGGASDLVQEVCLDAHRHVGGFRGTTPAEVIGWLNRLLLNRLSKFDRAFHTAKRNARREVPLGAAGAAGPNLPPAPAPGGCPAEAALARERAEAVGRALGRLPDALRRVVELRQRDRQPFDEIARRLGRTEAAVRRAWARGLEWLRRELDEAHGHAP
jgi:RNA polymerase sigma-70 factor, ECF subfamily